MIDFFILAGGYGKRAYPLTLYKPKPLFPLNGNPLINLILDQLAAKGLRRGFINLHYQGDTIKKTVRSSLHITYLHEEKLSGNKILSQTADLMENKWLLIINGDMWMEIPLAEMIEVASDNKVDGIIVIRQGNRGDYNTIEFCGNDLIGRKKGKNPSPWMYTGVALFKQGIVSQFTDLNMFDSLDRIGGRVKVLNFSGLWLDMGTPELYLKTNLAYKEYVKDSLSNALSPAVEISSESQVEKSVIWENTVIKGHSQIKQSIITGNMVIKDVHYYRQIITDTEIFSIDDFSPNN